jgi:predicted permease
MTPSLSKGLSQLSVKLAIPALLFSSVVPGVSFGLLAYAWPLILLPAVYLLLGMLIGRVMIFLVPPPRDFRLGTMAACTFGNTTGIPVVLLSVLQQSLSRSVFAEIADPLLFLSITLVSYPLLQWLFGLALLQLHRGGGAGGGGKGTLCGELCGTGDDEGGDDGSSLIMQRQPIRRHGPGHESSSYISMMSQAEDEVVPFESISKTESFGERLSSLFSAPSSRGRKACDIFARALVQLLRRTFVPQVVGIVLGALVGLYGRALVLPPETAPLGWMFIAVSKLGAAAVPINLILLGAALSRTPEKDHLPPLNAAGIAVGRMIFMPLCGLAVARLLSASRFATIPYMVADPFWLVTLILTATPTANNIVVLCEVAGDNRRAMSASIFYQYCAAPFLLPGVLTLFITFICHTRNESEDAA